MVEKLILRTTIPACGAVALGVLLNENLRLYFKATALVAVSLIAVIIGLGILSYCYRKSLDNCYYVDIGRACLWYAITTTVATLTLYIPLITAKHGATIKAAILPVIVVFLLLLGSCIESEESC